MSKRTLKTDVRAAAQSGPMGKLLTQYGCSPVKFSGADEALYERHLLFDSVTAITVADARDRFEAIARSVRDVLYAWVAAVENWRALVGPEVSAEVDAIDETEWAAMGRSSSGGQ